MLKSRPNPRIIVRKARSSDRDTVFKFCQKTFTWGDYVPNVWNSWLKDKQGRLFVATINTVPVGIAHLSLDKRQEAWLSGARTDPKCRRMGIATAITKKSLQYAKREGATTARLVTSSENTAAQAVLKKLGFKPIAQFVEMKTENVKKEDSTNSGWAEKAELVWNYLQASETYCKSAGLCTVLFHWFSLSKNELRLFVQQRKAIVHLNQKASIDGLTLIDDGTAQEWQKNTLQTCYIDGNYEAVLDMMKFLKSECHARKVRKIYGFTCNCEPIIAALEKLDFEPPDSIDIVYQKQI